MKKSNPNATHIHVIYKGHEGRKQRVSMLYRADDGIQIAFLSRAQDGLDEKSVVIYGDNPNRRASHIFLDDQHAEDWMLKTYAAEDLKERDIEKPVVIEERDGLNMILLPDDAIVMPGTVRPMGKVS